MNRGLTILASGSALVALLALEVAPVGAADPACRGSVASGARFCVGQTPSPYDRLIVRLNADLARAVTEQQRLSTAVDNAAAAVQMLSDQLTQEENRVADLQDQIAQLDDQIADLQTKIDTERTQIATLARAMYRQPASFLDIVASSGNLSDALSAAADLVVAGQRAHVLKVRLQADLATLNADRAARQSDLDQENATLAQVQAGLDQLTSIQATLDDLTSQLSDLISQIQDAVAGLPADLTTSLAQMIEQSEQSVIAQVEAAAWAEANAGAGLATDLLQLPTGSGPSGITFSWPMVSFQVTQPFGPTTFALEPPLGPYPHFHTGIDIAAARGTPVLAAADGIVVAVWHTGVGYGNYVIIAHGSEVLSLYAHLDETDVTLGQKILRTQIIGREGSTGWSTGPHVHFEIRFHNQFVDPAKYLPPA